MIDFIDIHTHRIENDDKIISILNVNLPSNKIPQNINISLGWHPWFIESVDIDQIQNTLLEVSTIQNLLAIGECGLDRTIKTSIEKQVDVFIIHLKIAQTVKKPIIVHCVRAYSDLLEILKKENYKGTLILHNFNGNQQIIDRFLKYDTFFSFSKKQLLYNLKLERIIPQIPTYKIFFETDDSNFSIKETYSVASDLFQIPIEKLKVFTIENFKQLFNNQLSIR